MEKETKIKTLVLIGYFNGHAHIKEQLDSLNLQSDGSIDVAIFDDRSCLESWEYLLEICQNYEWIKKVERNKTNKGFARNFIDALVQSEDTYGYYAFCDQDDVWYPDKIRVAIEALAPFGNAPALFCSRTTYVNHNFTKKIGLSPLPNRSPSFQNSMVENMAGGNTMVINNKGYQLIKSVDLRGDVPAHDWLVYSLITGVDGKLIFHKNSLVYYRQHENNAIGAHHGFHQTMERFKALFFHKTYQKWITANLKIMVDNLDIYSHQNKQAILALKSALEESSMSRRIMFFLKSGAKRQSKLHQLILIIALCLNCIRLR